MGVARGRAARFGLAPGDVNAVVQAAIGGQSAGDLYEEGSDRHFPMVVRLSAPYRQSLEAIGRVPIAAPSASGGAPVEVLLADVADIRLTSGASFIYREQQERYVPIKFSVRGRDLGSAILEAQKKLATEVQLPSGYRLEWAGEFGNLQDAVQRLMLIVPLTILFIAALLYLHFASI